MCIRDSVNHTDGFAPFEGSAVNIFYGGDDFSCPQPAVKVSGPRKMGKP